MGLSLISDGVQIFIHIFTFSLPYVVGAPLTAFSTEEDTSNGNQWITPAAPAAISQSQREDWQVTGPISVNKQTPAPEEKPHQSQPEQTVPATAR